MIFFDGHCISDSINLYSNPAVNDHVNTMNVIRAEQPFTSWSEKLPLSVSEVGSSQLDTEEGT